VPVATIRKPEHAPIDEIEGLSRRKVLASLIVSWGLAILWVLASPPGGSAWDAEEATQRQLSSAQKLIDRFTQDYGETPYSITELRTYASLRDESFSAYDAFGERMDYLRLDPGLYIMRSFGRDGRQNTPATPRDPAVGSFGKRVPPGLIARVARQGEPSLHHYPAPLLLGADSPNRIWTARIHLDRSAGSKRLLVRHHGGDGQFFMVAPHDSVEEFLWLPSGYQIVFTAAQSARYRDGIYLWNLLDDSMVNILDSASRDARVGLGMGDSLTATLASVTVEGPTLYTFLLRQSSNTPIHPRQFFSDATLVAFRLGENRVDLSPVTSEWKAAAPALLSAQEGAGGLDSLNGSAAQTAWFNLPRNDTSETTLAAWQEFVEGSPSSPLFPYGLWTLASMYIAAAEARLKTAPREAEVLRGYGVEVAKALAGYSLAPRYLRLMGADLYQRLLDTAPAPIPTKP
jgi:hypothetical protein